MRQRRGLALLLAVGLILVAGLALEAAHRHVTQRQREEIRRRDWNALKSKTATDAARRFRQVESAPTEPAGTVVHTDIDAAGEPFAITVTYATN